MSFFENTRKPAGIGGRLMVSMMNTGHRALAGWGMEFLPLAPDARVLNCGCGGGANIRELLRKCPQGIVKGIDYSAVSVKKARGLNEKAVQEGRCVIWQGSVERIIFADAWFDAVTAFETVYFWPDLPGCFREVRRVLKPGGIFLICNECGGDSARDDKWTEMINGMTIYKDAQLKAALEQAGFRDVQIHKNERGWLGIEPQSIRHILITHQDTDHVGAVEADSPGLFRNAKLYIGEDENRYLTGEVRRRVIYHLYKLPQVTIHNEKVLLRDGQVFDIAGIRIECFLVPGHTYLEGVGR